MNAKTSFLVIFLPVALIALTGSAGQASSKTIETFIPQIANIGGVQMGYSTQEELAQHWGEGLTVTGGHPNSGRRWRVRHTDWIIATDGFYYSKRGLVIDELEIAPRSAKEAGTNAPFAKLDKKALAWLDAISRGMTKPQVIAALNRHSLKFKSQSDVLVLEAEGFSPITSELNGDFHRWQAMLVFDANKLSRLQLSATR